MADHCEVCLDDADSCGCAQWDAYWNSLTPDQRLEEIRMMDEYANEDRDG